jgi:hypothetical protein
LNSVPIIRSREPAADLAKLAVADDPLASVVLGTCKMLSDFKLLRKISIE